MLPEYSKQAEKGDKNEIIRDYQSQRRQGTRSRRKMNKWGNRRQVPRWEI